MSLELQFRALYRLYYKRTEREAFLRGGGTTVAGLDDAEVALLRALEPARLRRVVELHAGDIGHQWYRPRVPASWLALQAALEIPEAELVHRLTDCAAFESRVNDDSDCRALAGFVDAVARELAETPWLPELLRYERLLGCPWPQGPKARDTRLERFAYDVGGIRDSLLRDGLCPTGEPRRATSLLLHRALAEVREVAVKRAEADVIEALLAGSKPKAAARTIQRAQAVLAGIRK